MKMKKKCLDLLPVSPFSSGEGLPYAPIDWPCPGDNWRWKVGCKIGPGGYYYQRYLYPPIQLQKFGCTKQRFAARTTLEHYIRTKFPGANFDAFFASFSWKVLAMKRCQPKVKAAAPHPSNTPHRMRGEKHDDKVWEEEEETTRTYARRQDQKPLPIPSTSRRQTRHSFKRYFSSTTKHEVFTIDLTEETETSNSLNKDSSNASGSENDQVFSNQSSVYSVCSSFGTHHLHVAHKESVMDARQEPPNEMTSEDGDYRHYVNSLPQNPSSRVLENEMAEAQMKLSSLLAMDFPLLISTENLTELTNLLSKLRKDRRLTLDQLLKLQLIEEIPLTAKHFLETKQYIEDADGFLVDLETNIAQAISLNKNSNESKEKAAQIQGEIDSNSCAMREIDDQIAQLQSRRAELADDVNSRMVVKNQLLSAQTKVMDSLSRIIQKVEVGNSEKEEWELKKANAAKHVAEILSKYETLKGFSL